MVIRMALEIVFVVTTGVRRQAGSRKPVPFFTKRRAEAAQDDLIRLDMGLTSFVAHHWPTHSCPVAFRYHPVLRRNALWKSARAM